MALVAACWLLGGLAPVCWAEMEMPPGDPREPITIYAQRANRWRQGVYEVWLLREHCRIEQGNVVAQCHEAVLWIDRSEVFSSRPNKVIAYLEGGVEVNYGHGGPPHRVSGKSTHRLADRSWFGRFHTIDQIQMRVPIAQGEPEVKPALFQRGLEARNPYRKSDVQAAQFTSEEIATPSESALTFSGRNVRILPRSNVLPSIVFRNNPERNEAIALITSGVHVILDDVRAADVRDVGDLYLGKIDIETDRLVIWTANLQNLNLPGADDAPRTQPSDMPLELYMEGNIVFRQGDRVIYAQRMYYNVNQENGVVIDAEVLTPVPDYEGLLRLKADVLQQVDRHNFQAYGAALTSSRMGVPGYWIQASEVIFSDVQRARTNPFTQQIAIDPITNEPETDHQLLATSRNNFLYLNSIPVLYWPVLATDLTKPTYYVENLRIKNDNVFGLQVLTELNAYHLLGIRSPPEGTDWRISPDYLDKRGFGLGTDFRYDRFGLFGRGGRYRGFVDAWGIKDDGLDDLGADRRGLVPEEEVRGRILWQHRQDLGRGFQLTGELGLISDRNFLEQYFENEWDEWKDQTTGVELKRYDNNQSWSISGDARVNDFFTQTEWLPRFDHFLLGQSLLFDRVTWSAHSQVAYARLRTASTPTDPVDAATFALLPWEVDANALRVATRHELDLPLQMGPVKVVPYLLGEVAHWGQDISGVDVTRAYGQAGLRASMPLWNANPLVHNQLLNLNGLAHKVVLEGDFFWADADQDLNRFPLYDPLDDDSVEHFRRRFAFTTFGGMTPLRFDERYYALRTGMQNWVTAPSTEIAEDLTLARLAIRQRWQTKRGLPGQERIVDWIVLDLEGTLFPQAARDNFDEDVGLLNYDFRWHVGDRFTLLSDGFVDIFADGLRTFTLGGILSRPEQGSVYVGFRTIEGPVTSNVLTASLGYRMSEKWIVTAGTAFDFGPTGNIGQSLALTRIGESALIRVGFIADRSRDNIGVQFAIEPRFLPRNRLGRVAGVQILPAGALGLE